MIAARATAAAPTTPASSPNSETTNSRSRRLIVEQWPDQVDVFGPADEVGHGESAAFMHNTRDSDSDSDGIDVKRANELRDNSEHILGSTCRSGGFSPLEYIVAFVDGTDLDVRAPNVNPDDNQFCFSHAPGSHQYACRAVVIAGP